MTDKLLNIAKQWLNDHRDHVKNLSENSKTAIKPSGEDYNNPALWKGCHWNWFLAETQIELTIRKKPSFIEKLKYLWQL